MNAAHHNDVGISLFGFARQCQAVANEVGNFLKGAICVIVRKNDCIFFFTHAAYLSLQVYIFCYRLIDIAKFFPFFLYHSV